MTTQSAQHTPKLWTGRVLPGGLRPFCFKCNWRKGGPDSWNGRACKCGHTEPPLADTEMAFNIREGIRAAIDKATGITS